MTTFIPAIRAKNIMRHAALIGLAVSLSGCSTLSDWGVTRLGQSLWTGTQSVASQTGRTVNRLFRPAPQQHYVFDNTDDAGLNTARLAAKLHTQTAPNDWHNSSPQRMAALDAPSLRGRYSVYGQGYSEGPAAAPTPVQTDDDALSYVKIGGGSRMADWQACEAEAGGYFQMTPSGFVVEPAFDRCMRRAGYVSEAEAQARFAAQDMQDENVLSDYAP